MYNSNIFKSKWIDYIKSILVECNLNDVWVSQDFRSVYWLKSTVFNSLKTKFTDRWSTELQNMTSCDLYAQFKTIFKFEKYLVQLPPLSRATLCKFRTNNTRLPIVLGRYTKTPRNLRFCTLCTNEEIGNEFHILFECNNPQIIPLRALHIPTEFSDQPSLQKCADLLGSDNLSVIRNVALFLKKVLKFL